VEAHRVITARSGSGLGDSLYLRPVAEHLARKGLVTVVSNYPDVFIGAPVLVEPFRRHKVDVVAHYVARKHVRGTNQWQDVLLAAGIAEALPLRFAWKVRNTALVENVRHHAAGRPIVLVHGGRPPMDRADGFGLELLPRAEAFHTVLGALSHAYRVRVGRDSQAYPLACDIDYNRATSVSDVLDLASISDAVVCQCSFAIPLAEAFDKPLLAIWSARAQSSREEFIRTATPQKILSGARDTFVVDDWSADRLTEAARALCPLQ
jgi:hypothetical protein